MQAAKFRGVGFVAISGLCTIGILAGLRVIAFVNNAGWGNAGPWWPMMLGPLSDLVEGEAIRIEEKVVALVLACPVVLEAYYDKWYLRPVCVLAMLLWLFYGFANVSVAA